MLSAVRGASRLEDTETKAAQASARAIPGPNTKERERNRTLAAGIATSILSRGISALVPIIILPLALAELGVDTYGVWATAVSITSLAIFADLGVGTGLMTRLGQLDIATAEGQRTGRRYVAAAYFMTGAISLVLVAALLAISPMVDWSAIFHSTSARGDRIRMTCIITFAAFSFNICLALIVRVQYAFQRQGEANLWQTAGSLIALGFAWMAAKGGLGSSWFVAAVSFTPLVVNCLNTVRFFVTTRPGRALKPQWSDIDRATVATLLRLGSRYLTVSILLTVSTQVDLLIVARTSNATDASTFSVPMRIFALIGTVSLMLTLPLWPLHANAARVGDLAWIIRITRRMTALTGAVVGLIAIAAVLVGPLATRLWLHNKIPYHAELWIGLGAWWFVQSVTGAAFMAQNGAEVLKEQILGYSLFLASIPVKWVVSDRYGFTWIPYVGVVAYVATVWPACFAGYRRTLRLAAHNATR